MHRSVALTGEPNYRVARIPVFSALNIAKWRELLQHYPDNVICDFLEFGWPIGYMSDTLPIFDLRTHRGALTFPDQVNAYLSKEVRLGRIAGPFDKAPFMQGFVLSPLNTVEKRDSEERRVIVDLSWPSGHSVNDGIPSDSYLGAPLSLRYPTIDDIVDAVVTLGRGCYLYKRDLRKAYRQFPVDPKIILFWDTLGTNSFISTPFSRWDCALPLWRVNALLLLLPGSHHNKDAWCLTI